MRRKFRRALKNLKQVYNFPNPTHENAFFEKSEEKMGKKTLFFPFFKNKVGIFQMAVACTVVTIMIGGYGVYQNYKTGRNHIFIEESSPSTESDVSHPMEKKTQPVSSTSPRTSSPTFASVSKESSTSVRDENVTDSTQTIPIATHNHTEVYPTEEHQTSQSPFPATVTKEPPSTTQTISSTNTAAITTGTTVKTTTKTTTKPIVSSTTIPTTPKPEDDVNGTVADYRVTPSYQYEKSEPILEIDDFLEGCIPPTGDALPFLSWDTCADLSDLIVSGTVLSVTYTREGNNLWTQVDIEITAVYQGTLHPGDKISIYESGGYIPLSEFLTLYPECDSMLEMTEAEIQNVTCFDSGEQITSSVQGENCLYFLKEGTAIVPAGAYLYAGNADDSRYQGDDNNLENVLYGENTLSTEDLIAYLHDEES